MRRHCVFFFTLVFWSLAVCTILSTKIEEQMTAEVVIVESEKYTIPMDVLFQDEMGDHVYHVVSGEGFEKGKRVDEVTYGNYWLNEDCVGVNLEELKYIRYASKEIGVGDLVKTTSLHAGNSEEYLVINSQQASVVVVENALHPFMAESVKIYLNLCLFLKIISMRLIAY